MEKNKTGKYFKYAIGETALVVIGILIALQINNWNEGPKQSYKSCLRVFHLTKKVVNTRLDNACNRALCYGAYNYNIIERVLKNGLDSLDGNIEPEIDMPNQDKIRGGHYYK